MIQKIWKKSKLNSQKIWKMRKKSKGQKGANKATKMKRYRDKMKTDTDKYEQMKKE